MLFNCHSIEKVSPRHYRPILTVEKNRKGVLDVDTVKGCTYGMQSHPDGGCYGECYANKTAKRYGIDFTVSISRKVIGTWHLCTLKKIMADDSAPWYRVGVFGDPCHDWDNTTFVIKALRHLHKIPVVVTKHWVPLPDEYISRFRELSVVVNTSVSGMDTDQELSYRIGQLIRFKHEGVRSICRVISCDYGSSQWAKQAKEKQDYLFSLSPLIDNPLRASPSNPRVLNGDIILTRHNESVGGGRLVSLYCDNAYLGKCSDCPDQCGVDEYVEPNLFKEDIMAMMQPGLFPNKHEFLYVESIIGSGFEEDVAKLALEDGIAHRAARKNMQIHSAIILKVNSKFAGFFTFQKNHEVKEFCLLQSVIRPDLHSDELYRELAEKVVEQNKEKYPAIITTDPRSSFETPALFESLGFKTYLKMSGFHYMVKGELSSVRHKLLAHITMTNVWDSTKGDWLRLKKEWKKEIEDRGLTYSIEDPMFATRKGCWQGESGFANVVTGHAHNGNASVLDPTACEVILRMFIPTKGRRIYNPFGGGVQFGFIAGWYGYEYLASEIRQNQCDANNKLCSEFKSVKWVKADSSVYQPKGMFDLVFSCPPYYRVERYEDYDGNPPPGEINTLPKYEEFRDALFSGYKIAIDRLNNNCFIVIMTGDSRDNKGAYRCSESETELFLKEQGLAVYNRIVYLEGEFTRLAQAKKTLNMRKFPKREQKIIVAYKGDIAEIKNLYMPIGRL